MFIYQTNKNENDKNIKCLQRKEREMYMSSFYS